MPELSTGLNRHHLHPDVWTVRAGSYSFLVSKRASAAVVGLGLLLFVSACLSVAVGSGETTGFTAVKALFGEGTQVQTQIVQVLRLPRFAAGAAAGAALGVAGCLIQTLARNRLATPDIIGVNDGAVAGVLLVAIASSAAAIGAWWAGPAGAAVAAAIVVAAAGSMGTTGYRVLVVGIGVAVMLDSLVQLTLARQDLDAARSLYTWSLGYLNGRDYSSALPVAIGLAVLLPVALAVARRLNLSRLGEEVPTTLGVPLNRVRFAALIVAVGLAGLGVGVGGPIAFIALAAPIIASRLAGPRGVPLLVSALSGAALVTLCDTLGRVVGAAEVPVGVLTSLLGGPFLLWVLLTRKV
ncbi:iron chelate uptake ABC transporter family permease subunit [Natronoglycomyces albus]|uniref:Iron chelate uptake ABC transporter family permease subunit n=2 Tax=Natronoglycomyces albus TaxID=2811108 RepID=A0A895XXU5_9ACTN|nr:iron chelate uptake ABC transporter family permease subunit [Natronoglycomyces albus]